MITIANAQFWVHDQDEALAFYTRTLGWEVRSDVTMEEWNFRWLVVGPVGQDDIGLVLMPIPGPPMLDADSQRAARRAGGQGGRRHAVPRRPTTARPPTTSCRPAASCSTTRRRAQPYGIDTSFRDPSGNNVRLTQVMEFSLDRA